MREGKGRIPGLTNEGSAPRDGVTTRNFKGLEAKNAAYDSAMLPCTTGLLVLFTILWTGSVGCFCHAQKPAPVAPVRYHLGDDARWADPAFDDNAWPVAEQGRWAMPPAVSDGFEWARVRVPVRRDAAGALAIRVTSNGVNAKSFNAMSYEVFVNGRSVGTQGGFAPTAAPVFLPEGAVFELPAGLVQPGKTALVAYRVWLPPGARWTHFWSGTEIALDDSRNLQLAIHDDAVTALLAIGPDLGLYGIIAVLGIGLLLFWRRANSRELLWCSALLLFYSIAGAYLDLSRAGLFLFTWRMRTNVIYVLMAVEMAVTVEFIWTIFGLRARGLKRLAQISLVLFCGSTLYSQLIVEANNALPWVFALEFVSLSAFNLITIGAEVWAFFANRRDRFVAAALIIIPIASILSSVGITRDGTIGIFYVDLFEIGFFATSLALFVTLGQRAWESWRARDELRVEFEAAREMQEHLVAPAVNVPGFTIESVYAPAKQVGGDFFRVIPDEDGVLVVVGDVSGKGLKAAMTVSAIMGALRGCNSRGPAEVLEYLNGVLYGQVGGFVTCCAAHIGAGGAMTYANAGNPAPYRNGEEMNVEPGVPLGIVAEARYEETRCRIVAGDRLTFVSDGVLEATDATGELYGFDRTKAVSGQAAHAIAEAARLFGQEDDITVLSITRNAGLEPAVA